MSETIKRFISNIRSLFSQKEKTDLIYRISDEKPDEREISEDLNLDETTDYEISREIET